MSITLKMSLVPFGSRFAQEVDLLEMQLYTMPFGKEPRHGYSVRDNTGNIIADGVVPKTISGHRNPLHLLKAVLDDIDLDGLGLDYITTDYDNSATKS